MSQDNPPKKLKPYDLSSVYSLDSTPSADLEDEDIHWSCERFWGNVRHEWCCIRRYTLEEVEEYEDNDY